MDRPSYLLDIPADQYHAATKANEYTTSHRLQLFRRCPKLFKKTIDGRVIGKMGHSERWAKGLYKNVDGKFDMGLFRSAVEYYKF